MNTQAATIQVVFNGESCVFKSIARKKGDKESVTVHQQKNLEKAGVIEVTGGTK